MAKSATSKSWTPSEVNQLWEGSLGEVAKAIGRSKGAVSVARTTFKRFKPGSGVTASEENMKTADQKKATSKRAKSTSRPARKATKKKNAKKVVPKKAAVQRTSHTPSHQSWAGYLQNDSFKMEFNGQTLEFQSQPKTIKIGVDGLEVNF